MNLETKNETLKYDMQKAFRALSLCGFEYGTTGHISFRDYYDQSKFWVNPFGVSWSKLEIDDLIQVDIDENGELKTDLVNPPAFHIHSSIYRKRTEISCVAHAHPFYGQLWSSTKRLLPCLTQDMVPFYKDHQVYETYSGIVGSENETDSICQKLGKNKALILSNHGLLTVGRSIEAACWWLYALESACKLAVIGSKLENVNEIDSKIAITTHKVMGKDKVAERHFNVLLSSMKEEN